MKKCIIIILMMLLLFKIAIALDECKGTMLTNEIPCLVLLPYTNDCTTIGIKFYHNGSTLLDDRLMSQYSPFNCNQTFNYTSFGTYTFNYSTGDSGSIVIEEDETQEVYLYIFSLIIFFILVGIGYAKEIAEFVMIAGMLAIIIGIVLVIYGFPNLTSVFLKNSVAVIFWGVGAYLILEPAMDFFERWK